MTPEQRCNNLLGHDCRVIPEHTDNQQEYILRMQAAIEVVCSNEAEPVAMLEMLLPRALYHNPFAFREYGTRHEDEYGGEAESENDRIKTELYARFHRWVDKQPLASYLLHRGLDPTEFVMEVLDDPGEMDLESVRATMRRYWRRHLAQQTLEDYRLAQQLERFDPE